MKYLCCLYYDTRKFAALSPAQLKAIGPKCAPHDAALRATGNVLVQASLAVPKTWKSLRPRKVKPVISDGPHLKTDQHIGAFLIVEAKGMAEAVRVASKHPAANIGGDMGWAVEVSVCESFEETEA
jgi:hypothetical protein